MKHNHTTNKETRSRPRGKYAEKRRSNKQMYSALGFTCCAHSRKSEIQQNTKHFKR